VKASPLHLVGYRTCLCKGSWQEMLPFTATERRASLFMRAYVRCVRHEILLMKILQSVITRFIGKSSGPRVLHCDWTDSLKNIGTFHLLNDNDPLRSYQLGQSFRKRRVVRGIIRSTRISFSYIPKAHLRYFKHFRQLGSLHLKRWISARILRMPGTPRSLNEVAPFELPDQHKSL
jgi:hypothetical protein